MTEYDRAVNIGGVVFITLNVPLKQLMGNGVTCDFPQNNIEPRFLNRDQEIGLRKH